MSTSRIKLGIYLPTHLLEDLQPELEYAFLEPNTDPQYIEYYRQYSGQKLLDNGFIENNHQAMEITPLVQYFRDVNADLIVAPDRWGNFNWNWSTALVLAEQVDITKILVILGGPNFQEEADKAWKSGFHHIGLPARRNRYAVIFEGHVHLFGMRFPEEYLSYCTGAKDVTMDTVEPISAAEHNWLYSMKGLASFPRPQDYADLNPFGSRDDHRINIRYLRDKLSRPDRRF